MKQINKYPNMLAKQRGTVVEYQPSDTDQYLVQNSVPMFAGRLGTITMHFWRVTSISEV